MKVSVLEVILIGLAVYVVVWQLKKPAAAAMENARKVATQYYSAGGNAATPGYPDLLADGGGRPPAGAVWDETQQGYVLRDMYGNVTGVYT